MKKILFSLILGLGLVSINYKAEAITITLNNKVLSALIASPLYLIGCHYILRPINNPYLDVRTVPANIYQNGADSNLAHNKKIANKCAFAGIAVHLVSYLFLNKYVANN